MSGKAGTFIRRALANQAPYPYPAFGRPEIAAVEIALGIAWRELVAIQSQRDIDLYVIEEEAISEHLADVLNTLAAASPSALPKGYVDNFSVMSRESALSNYNGTSISKQPDFSIQPRVQPRPGINPRLRCMFVEAKIYDEHRPIGNYVNTGLIRFVNGDYAWAMPQGFMLAYARRLDEAQDTLTRYFSKANSQCADDLRPVKAPAKSFKSRRQPSLTETVHSRVWRDCKFSPGEITVFHLWLRVQ